MKEKNIQEKVQLKQSTQIIYKILKAKRSCSRLIKCTAPIFYSKLINKEVNNSINAPPILEEI